LRHSYVVVVMMIIMIKIDKREVALLYMYNVYKSGVAACSLLFQILIITMLTSAPSIFTG